MMMKTPTEPTSNNSAPPPVDREEAYDFKSEVRKDSAQETEPSVRFLKLVDVEERNRLDVELGRMQVNVGYFTAFAFLLSNILIWGFMWHLLFIDISMLASVHGAKEEQIALERVPHLLEVMDRRVVDGEVLLTLIGATVVQLGAVMYAVTRNLFPSGAAD